MKSSASEPCLKHQDWAKKLNVVVVESCPFSSLPHPTPHPLRLFSYSPQLPARCSRKNEAEPVGRLFLPLTLSLLVRRKDGSRPPSASPAATRTSPSLDCKRATSWSPGPLPANGHPRIRVPTLRGKLLSPRGDRCGWIYRLRPSPPPGLLLWHAPSRWLWVPSPRTATSPRGLPTSKAVNPPGKFISTCAILYSSLAMRNVRIT